MHSHRVTLLKVVVAFGLLFGLLSGLSANPAAAQQPISCQYIYNSDGSVDVVQAVPDLQACATLFATSGPDGCQVTDSNGDGIPESVGPGGSACVFQGNSGTGGPCQIKDETPPDGVIDLVQGSCTVPQPTETPVTPTETPVTPTETPVTPTETPVTPTETPVTPTETPVTPTETPTGGKAEPDDKKVDVLPSTGHGPDSGSGTGLALLLGAMSAFLFAGGVVWQRRNA